MEKAPSILCKVVGIWKAYNHKKTMAIQTLEDEAFIIGPVGILKDEDVKGERMIEMRCPDVLSRYTTVNIREEKGQRDMNGWMSRFLQECEKNVTDG